jgi:uncharacterized membrane protein YbhN (UPF0104 family)
MPTPGGSTSTPRRRTQEETPPTSDRGDEGRALKLIVTLLVVGGGVGVASTLHRIDWATFGSALAHVSGVPLALALCVSTAQVFAQLGRFVVVLPRSERAPLRELLEATAVGQLLNYTTALRAGDAYKLARLSSTGKYAGERFSKLAAALVVERIADVVSLLAVAAATLDASSASLHASALPSRTIAALRQLLPWRLGGWAALLSLSFGVALAAGSLFFARAPEFVLRFARSVRTALGSAGFARCLVVASATWVLDAATLYWTARSAGCAISFRTAVPCVFLLNVGIALPVTVGNLGVFEASLAFALTLYGIPPERALVIATVEHAVKLAGLAVCVGILKGLPRCEGRSIR